MDTICILLIDLDSNSYSEDHGKQLTRLLCSASSMKSSTVRIITYSHSETLFTFPDLVVIRLSDITRMSSIIPDLKRKLCTVPFLGLFCMGQGMLSPTGHALLVKLDDFITCPFRDIDVLPRMQRLLQDQEAPGGAIKMPPLAGILAQLPHFGLVGESRPFLEILEQTLHVAQTNATIRLTGETGTGKELVARAAHYYSPRQREPFVPINCGALPEQLVENELFGHVKGAYTDATSPENGLVAEADGGTLFLDEVDALSPAIQVKLLRFLQEHEYRPVGGTRYHTADVRVIAASNADLWQLVQTKQFREDLYYRLNVIALCLLPLRQRRDDIPQLALHFLRRYNAQYGCEIHHFAAETLHKLSSYAWPGNIRELEAVIQRAVLVASTSVLVPDDIKLNHSGEWSISQETSLRAAKEHVVAQFERSYLSNLLAAHHGNITQAAKQAGKERRAFTRLLDKYNLQRSAFLA